MRFLIIADEKTKMQPFLDQLIELGVELHIKMCKNYEEVRDAINEITPNCVVLTSFHLHRVEKLYVEEIKNIYPSLHLVLISETIDYAVKAFEIGATDYIVLPSDKERIKKMVHRIVPEDDELMSIYSLSCFEAIKFKKNSKTIDAPWRTKKAQELFAYLLYKNNEFVRKDYLIDLLWPDVSFEKGRSLLYVNMHHIRKLLKKIEFPIRINNTENYYALYLDEVKYEVKKWEDDLEILPDLTVNNLPLYRYIIYQYEGDYLRQYDYLWAINEQNRLRLKWFELIKSTIQFCFDNSQMHFVKKIAYYMLEICPDIEDAYYYLMQVHAHERDMDSLKETFRNLRHMSLEEFGVEPTENIVKSYHQWLEELL